MTQNRVLIYAVLVVLTCLCADSVTIFEHTENDKQVCHLDGDNKLCTDDPEYNIRVYTVASGQSDGFQRFNRSARIYKIKFETLGMENDWHDEDSIYNGGGYKLNSLKRAINKLDDNADTLILYTDSCNVIYTQTLDEIGNKFRSTGAGILVGAQHILWPDESLEDLYPKIESGSRFVNGDMFIGYVSEVKQLLSSSPIRNTDSSQQFMTNAYLEEKLRSKLNLKLDHRSDIFQSLHGSNSHVSLESEDGEYFILNNGSATRPSIIQGNGPSGILLNSYGNYLAKAHTNGECAECKEYVIDIMRDDFQLPRVMLTVFIQKATPFFNRFLELLDAMDYPDDKLDLIIHNACDDYNNDITAFIESKSYNSVKHSLAKDKLDEAMARNFAVSHAMALESDYLFVIDAEARLDDAQTLRELLKQNRTFIAPMLKRHDEYRSNFWGALNKDGFYARSNDYLAIANETIRGIWNVPYISTCYLAKKSILPFMRYYDSNMDPDMVMCKSLRDKGIFMYVSNQHTFGHLINGDDYNLLRTVPDFYTMDTNRPDWERQYIHPDYAGHLLPDVTHKQPCPDVFWFPIVTERFCADLIAIMEAHGKWSDDGSSEKIGYDPVPTRDIHMEQVGLYEQWLAFLQRYVRPLQELVYEGYFHDPPVAHNNFVVRYKPSEQPFLRPHHDTSTYTINIALNRVGIDYEGGGCRFIRYNCSVTDTKVGHMLMHPGRLTHFHEGLYVTNGTRYIMVSFVDPE